ncbi:MAG: universal stress protein [Acidobacteriota bacterium]
MEKKILLAVDGSPKSFEAVRTVGSLLAGKGDVHLVVFHCVLQVASLSPGELCLDVEKDCQLPFKDQENVGNAVLARARRELIEAGVPEGRLEFRLKTNCIDAARDIMAEAEAQKVDTIALGRRGRGQLEALLLGSVSGKVAHYARGMNVWIVDSPVHASRRVMIAIDGSPESEQLTGHTIGLFGPGSNLHYTFVHIMPPLPPYLWDDGHILAESEQSDRVSRIDKWRNDWTGKVEKIMEQSKSLLRERNVPEQNIQTFILPIKEGVARDLLNEITEHQFQVVVMGKKSFGEKKPFLMGSHANKVLQNVKGTVLCMVDE